VAAAALPAASALTTTDGTITVNQSLTNGLQAIFTGASGTTANPFSRIDFYRQTAVATTFDYIGSATAAPTASTTAAALAQYTFPITSTVTTTPTGAAFVPVRAGDVVVAIGVRSNGLGTASTATTIGGAWITINLTGLPTASTVSVAIAGPSGFSTTVSAGNGATVVPVTTDGVYTLTYGSLSPATGGFYSPASATQTATVVGNGNNNLAANAYTFTGLAARVTVAGLPTGRTIARLTFSLAGQNNVVYTNVANGANQDFSLPAAGVWTITPGATPGTADSVTGPGVPTAGLRYGANTTTVNVTAGAPSPAAATIQYNIGTPHTIVSATAPTGVTLTPSFTFRSPGSTPAAPLDSAVANKTFSAQTGGTQTNRVTYPFNAGNSTIIANPVQVGTVFYGVPTATASQAATPSSAAPVTLTYAYNTARVAIVFSDDPLKPNGTTDLANYPIAINLTNGSSTTSLGTFQPSQNTAAINLATPTAGVVLTQSGLFGPVAIPSITIGTDVYSFTFTGGTGAARLYDYVTNATVINVQISKN